MSASERVSPIYHTMAQITPIDREWLCSTVAKRFLRPIYGKTSRLRLVYLPLTDIMPETFLKIKIMDVEIMLAILQAGGWLMEDDWHPFVRYTIAKRLRARSELIFREPFDEISQVFLDYQLNGGTFKTRDQLRSFVNKIIRMNNAVDKPFLMCGCRLILSVVGGVELHSLVHPFHWIRTMIAATETTPTYGMTLWHSEMYQQKVTLSKMLRATLSR